MLFVGKVLEPVEETHIHLPHHHQIHRLPVLRLSELNEELAQVQMLRCGLRGLLVNI